MSDRYDTEQKPMRTTHAGITRDGKLSLLTIGSDGRHKISVVDLRPLGERTGCWYVVVEEHGARVASWPVQGDAAHVLAHFDELLATWREALATRREREPGYKSPFTYRLFNASDEQVMAVSL